MVSPRSRQAVVSSSMCHLIRQFRTPFDSFCALTLGIGLASQRLARFGIIGWGLSGLSWNDLDFEVAELSGAIWTFPGLAVISRRLFWLSLCGPGSPAGLDDAPSAPPKNWTEH